jgi:hypothetical protein
MEVLEAAAIKRAVRWRASGASQRPGVVLASTTAVEVETVGEDTPEERIANAS